jgi:hypothetical protein
MRSPTITMPLSARLFLFGPDSLSQLEHELTQTGALEAADDRFGAIGGVVWAGARREITRMANDFLDLDLGSVAVAGYRKHRELMEAGRRTAGTTASVVVPLGTRNIVLTQRPQIDVLVGDTAVNAIKFELKVEIAVTGVAGTVRDGALVVLAGGRCEVAASFSAAGVRIAQRTAELDPQWTIPLGSGIRLSTSPVNVNANGSMVG